MSKRGEAELLIGGKSVGVKMQLEETLWELQIPGTVSLYQDFLYSDPCVQMCQTTHLAKPVAKMGIYQQFMVKTR